MKSLRSALASVAVVTALVAPGLANAQSAPMPYAVASDPGIPHATTQQQRDDVMKLITAHLGLWSTRDPNSYPYERLVTDDAVFEYPYASAESDRRIEGRTAVAEALRKLSATIPDRKVTDIRLFETPHPDIFFVSYKATAPVPASKQTFEQRYLARITVRDGKISNYLELWDREAEASAKANTAHN
jgi:ketosteroid isomerase-like protein